MQNKITSREQLDVLANLGRASVEHIRVTRDADGRAQAIHVRLLDGREGERTRVMTERGVTWQTSGALDEQEWVQANAISASWTHSTKWLDWDADRFPDFARRAADRPVAGMFKSLSRHVQQPGMPLVDWTDRDHPRVLIVRREFYTPSDESNESDDAFWVIECVEPTEAERAASFVQHALQHEQEMVDSERKRYDIMMRNTEGWGN